MTFWSKVASVGTKGEVKKMPSLMLWPITTLRDLSYCPSRSRGPGRAGAKLPSTTGSMMHC